MGEVIQFPHKSSAVQAEIQAIRQRAFQFVLRHYERIGALDRTSLSVEEIACAMWEPAALMLETAAGQLRKYAADTRAEHAIRIPTPRP